MIIKRDELFRVVCELLTPGISSGTGMFVSSPENNNMLRGWIVTATHVAKKTNMNTILIISSDEGKAIKLPLNMFGNISEWKHHQIADISILPIVLTNSNNKYLVNRLFPYDHIFLDEKPVSRDYELTSIGFPMVLFPSFL